MKPNETGNEMIVAAQTQILTLVDMAVNLGAVYRSKDVNLAPKSQSVHNFAEDSYLAFTLVTRTLAYSNWFVIF